jgi:hypothetical protein
MDWARILAYVTGTVDQELLARNEYLATENRIFKAQLRGRLKLSDTERKALGEIGHRLGRKALADVATIARPDTILGWYRKLVARKFDGSKARRGPGRPRIKREVEQLIIRMACACRKLYPAIMMMKPAEDGPSGELAVPLERSMARRILTQGQMGPEFIVIVGVGHKDPAQMGLAEDDDVIEAFAADRADQPLRMPVLPR